MYSRLVALPAECEPVQRSRLAATLTVGVQVIRLRHISTDSRTNAEIVDILEALAAGDLPRLQYTLEALDKEIASIPVDQPGMRGRMRVRAMLLAIAEAVDRQGDYFGSQPS